MGDLDPEELDLDPEELDIAIPIAARGSEGLPRTLRNNYLIYRQAP